MSSRIRRFIPAGFIEPCLPSAADKPPSGSVWIHEIKHDGYRLMARRDPMGIRLLTRRGNDWSSRFPLIVEAVNHLRVRSCLIDGERCRRAAGAHRGSQGGTRQHPAQKRAWGAPSMSTLSTLMALKCSTTPAGWGWKGSFRSGWDRATGLAAHRTGSSSRTRKRLR